TMEPLRELLKAHLEHVGAEHAARQEAEAHRGVFEDCSEGEGQAHPIVESASGAFEATFHSETQLLLRRKEFWVDLIPPDHQTLSMRALACRMIWSCDCLVSEGLDVQHNTFPMKLFRLLGPRGADVDLHIPPCLFDEWSLDFVTRYRDRPGGLENEEARAELRLVAMLAGVNIAPVEATHSAVRRRLFTKRIQTWAQAFEELSAEFLLERIRRFGKAWEVVANSDGPGAEGAVEPADQETANCGEQRPTMREVAILYRNLSEHEMSELKSLAVLCDRAVQTAMQCAPADRQLDLGAIQKMARAALQAEQLALRADDARATECLVMWREAVKGKAEELLVSEMANFAECMATLSAAPHRCQDLFDFRHPAELSAHGAALAKDQSLKSNAVKSLESYWVALLREGFHSALRQLTKKGGMGRQRLIDRKVVVHLVGTLPERDAAESAWDEAEQEKGCALDIWWHVGATSLSPYKCTYRVLDFVERQLRDGSVEMLLK
ncbi:unnamed protein product, partial [Prorocentrum cordatum]